jgi:MprA protease rhombosortase-interaction domain-containing protein
MKRVYLFQSAAAAVCLIAANGALASNITFSASGGNRAASATFAASGSNLVVTLTNTSSADVLLPVDVLTAVFFDFGGSAPTLSRTSAVLGSGSAVLFGGTDPGNVVGGEWAYVTAGLSGGPHNSHYGISSTGVNLFGPGDLFPGSNLQGPSSPDGLQYGITSAGDDPATGNTPVTGTNALIQNSVVFTLGNLPAGFDPSATITNVSFQYGTSLEDPNLQVPAPSAAALLTLGALGFGRRRRA